MTKLDNITTQLTQLINQLLVLAPTYYITATNVNIEQANASTTLRSEASSSESNNQLLVPPPTYCINTANLMQAQANATTSSGYEASSYELNTQVLKKAGKAKHSRIANFSSEDGSVITLPSSENNSPLHMSNSDLNSSLDSNENNTENGSKTH